MDVILVNVERGGKELEVIHVGFIMTEEAKEFKVVGRATISVKVWD